MFDIRPFLVAVVTGTAAALVMSATVAAADAARTGAKAPAAAQARGSKSSTLSMRALISMLRGMRMCSSLRRNLAQRALENLGRLAA